MTDTASPLETRKIGALDVTVIGLGCNNFGDRLDEAASADVIHATLDAGINFFDTADIYGSAKSEGFVGRALASRRDDVVIATKFGIEMGPDKKGAAPAYIRTAVEDSLRRLGTDRIDLYQLHRPDDSVPIADTLGALNDLVVAGKVREIGCSNFSAPQLVDAKAAAAGGAHFVSIQNHYSLLHRAVEREAIEEAEHEGVALLPYFPLASGLLTGKYRKGQPLPEGTRITSDTYFGAWLTDANLDAVEKLIAFAQERDHTILDLANAWLLTQPVVASVISGATKPAQAHANAAAGHWRLTPSEMADVDAIVANVEL